MRRDGLQALRAAVTGPDQRGIARFPGWVYAIDREGLRVNLYESGEATLQLDDRSVSIRQTSLYPDLGKVIIDVDPEVQIALPCACASRLAPASCSFSSMGTPSFPIQQQTGTLDSSASGLRVIR